MTSPSPVLEFTRRVLGKDAAAQLRDRKVLQTIRSYKSGAKFLRFRGYMVQVKLDDVYLYDARVTEAQRKEFSTLSDWDATMGGFPVLCDLIDALKRAGFRFKPLSEYFGLKIEFLPQRETS